MQVDRVLASDNIRDGATTTGLASAGLVGLVLVRHCDGIDWVRWALNGRKKSSRRRTRCRSKSATVVFR